MKAAKRFLQRLKALGVEDCFLVPGGAIMHLVDELATFHLEGGIKPWPMHDERAAAMAAEGYARIKRKPALLLVSSGPGVLNALNGVWGAHVDSIPMIVVSGQVRSDTVNQVQGLRQLGDQELHAPWTVAKLVKDVIPVTPQIMLGDHLVDRAWIVATSGRPGPVWIDWPVDLQAKEGWQESETDPLTIQLPHREPVSEYAAAKVLGLIAASERPVVIAGTGVRHADACELLERFADQSKLPIVTAWCHDVLDHRHPQWIGMQGTLGDRAGNLAAQRADLLLVLGSRMSIRQTTYDWERFSPESKRIMVDVDEAEMHKPNFRVDQKITGCVGSFLQRVTDRELRATVPAATDLALKVRRRAEWLVQCQTWRDKYPTTSKVVPMAMIQNSWQGEGHAVAETEVLNGILPRKHTDAGLNPYLFLSDLLCQLPEDVVVVTSDATAYIVTHQVSTGRHRMFSNSGCASMGYGITAAIGAAVAGAKVLCVEGDGSIMQNLSCLASLSEFNLPVNVVVLCNGGYASIKSTHQRMFGRPPLEPKPVEPNQVISALGINCTMLLTDHVFMRLGPNGWARKMDWNELEVQCVRLDPSIPIEPRLEARVVDGRIVTATLDKMTPEVEE